MNQMLNTLITRGYRNILLKECKRYAGHSKWANIKHTKAENDTQRAALFQSLRMKMRVAIAEGGSSKPAENLRLNQLIELAKKSNMPATTIKTFLEKIEKSKDQTDVVEVRGPGGFTMVVHLITDNISQSRMQIKARLKKYGAKSSDNVTKALFTHTCYVTAEKECTLDQVLEDAINLDIEDVKEVNEDGKRYFKLICDPNILNRTITQLKKLGYHDISVEEEWVPNMMVELNDEYLENATKLREKLFGMDEVQRIDDNIAQT